MQSSAEYRAYLKRHRMVVRLRGKASEYYCIDCGGDAQEWAQIHGTDGESAKDYEPRCCSCHQKYDDHWDRKTRNKVGLSASKRWQDPEYKNAVSKMISIAKRASGYKHSEATKKKISATKKGVPGVGKGAVGSRRTPEQCERIRIGRWGR